MKEFIITIERERNTFEKNMKKVMAFVLILLIVFAGLYACSIVSFAANKSTSVVKADKMNVNFDSEADMDWFESWMGGSVEYSATGGKDGTGALKYIGTESWTWASPSVTSESTRTVITGSYEYRFSCDIYIVESGAKGNFTFCSRYNNGKYAGYFNYGSKPEQNTWINFSGTFTPNTEHIAYDDHRLAFDNLGTTTCYIDNFVIERIPSDPAVEITVDSLGQVAKNIIVIPLNDMLSQADFEENENFITIKYAITNLTGEDRKFSISYTECNSWMNMLVLVPNLDISSDEWNEYRESDKVLHKGSTAIRIKNNETGILELKYPKVGYWDHIGVKAKTELYFATAGLRITSMNDSGNGMDFDIGDKVVVAVKDEKFNKRFIAGVKPTGSWVQSAVITYSQEVVSQSEVINSTEKPTVITTPKATITPKATTTPKATATVAPTAPHTQETTNSPVPNEPVATATSDDFNDLITFVPDIIETETPKGETRIKPSNKLLVPIIVVMIMLIGCCTACIVMVTNGRKKK